MDSPAATVSVTPSRTARAARTPPPSTRREARSGGTPYWTNLLVTTEAFIRGGANAAADQDEVATDYIMVKYNPSPLDTSRKAYFQFDLTGLNVNASTQAVFTVTTHTQQISAARAVVGVEPVLPRLHRRRDLEHRASQ